MERVTFFKVATTEARAKALTELATAFNAYIHIFRAGNEVFANVEKQGTFSRVVRLPHPDSAASVLLDTVRMMKRDR